MFLRVLVSVFSVNFELTQKYPYRSRSELSLEPRQNFGGNACDDAQYAQVYLDV